MLQRVKASSPSWACVFPPGAPLRRGGVFAQAAGPGGCCKPWRDVGPRKELVPRPFTPHISTVLATPKRGATVSRTGHTELRVDHGSHPGHVRVERSMMNRGGCGRRDDCGKDPRCHRGGTGVVVISVWQGLPADLKTADPTKVTKLSRMQHCSQANAFAFHLICRLALW